MTHRVGGPGASNSYGHGQYPNTPQARKEATKSLRQILDNLDPKSNGAKQIRARIDNLNGRSHGGGTYYA